jgi:hypothetical protein
MNGAVRLAKNVQLNGGVAWALNQDLAGGRLGVRVGWWRLGSGRTSSCALGNRALGEAFGLVRREASLPIMAA